MKPRLRIEHAHGVVRVTMFNVAPDIEELVLAEVSPDKALVIARLLVKHATAAERFPKLRLVKA